MRRLLAHARLTPAARATVRRVLDEDDEFRSRVAEIVTEKAVGRPGWLFLARPEGWADRLAELTVAEADSEKATRVAQEERRATRRLRGAEEALRRTEDALTDTRAEAARAAAELARERHTRRSAEADADVLRDRVAALERSVGEADALRRRVVDLEAEVARLEALAQAHGEPVGAAAAAGAAQGTVPEPEPRPQPPAPLKGARVDPAASAVLQEAADTARALAAVLDELTAGVAVQVEGAPAAPAPSGPSSAASERPSPAPAPAAAAPAPPAAPAPAPTAPPPPAAALPAPPAPGRGAARAPAGRRLRRRPPALPPGMRDDTPEAAEAFVRMKQALLLVDGYNASLRWRQDLAVPELRRRLVAALEELAARTGVQVHVVFDGAEGQDPAGGTAAASRRTGVRVSFSPPDVEADDVILDLARAAPASRVVLVASDDRRVQDGAREQGAAVLSTAQLFAVLRRER